MLPGNSVMSTSSRALSQADLEVGGFAFRHGRSLAVSREGGDRRAVRAFIRIERKAARRFDVRKYDKSKIQSVHPIL